VQVSSRFLRDKLTFSWKEDNYKRKLYDEGATLSLHKAMEIFSLKEAKKREFQESKPQRLRVSHHEGTGQTLSLIKIQSKEISEALRGSLSKRMAGTVVTADMPMEGGTAQLRIHDVANAIKWDISLSHARVYLQNQSTKFSKLRMPLVPHSWEGLPHPLVPILPWQNQLQTLKLVGTSDPGWHVKLKIQDQDMLTWCTDTGAQVPLMPEAIYKSSYGMLSKSDRELVRAGDVPLVNLGCAVMNLTLDETVIKVYVVRGASKLLLGVPAIQNLGLIHEIPGTYSVKAVSPMPVNRPLQSGTKEDILTQYPTLFEGKLVGDHTIHLKERVTPFCLTTPRRVPLSLMKKVQEEIKHMEPLDVIEPIAEPTGWFSPIVVVPKADKRVRICVDLTRLKQAVHREVYQMATVEETLGSLTKGSVFSKLDANSRLHQIVLNPESAKLTTFITPFGRYTFKRLPFGISSAPEYFQKRMDKEFSGIEGVKCHMDHILVVGRDLVEHDQ